MNEHDDLVARLGRLAQEPVDPAVASRHLTAMAGAPAARARRRGGFARPKLVAAFVAGLVLGGTGLASAGVLGDSVQNRVADTAAHVGVDLPGGTQRSTDGCGTSSHTATHGDFVSNGGDPHSNCGKPLSSVDKSGNHGQSGQHHGATPACKPPWAGKGNHDELTPSAVAAHNAACPDDHSVELPDQANDHAVTPTVTGGAPATPGAEGDDHSHGHKPPATPGS
jgi:hypothetical protein